MNDDPHAQIRREHQIIMRYWRARGVRADQTGSTWIDYAMRLEALQAAADAQAEGAAKGPPVEVPAKHALELQEPGSGTLRGAILCPGPSLERTWRKCDRSLYDWVAGVNQAPVKYDVDWWVCQDLGQKKNHSLEVRPRFGILTSGATAQTLNGDRSFSLVADLDKLVVVGSNTLNCKAAPQVGGFSTTYAITLLARIGCNRIDLYGDDKEGTVYCDGSVANGQGANRWERELEQQTRLVARLAECGVTVTRVRPPAAEPPSAEI